MASKFILCWVTGKKGALRSENGLRSLILQALTVPPHAHNNGSYLECLINIRDENNFQISILNTIFESLIITKSKNVEVA